MKTKMFWMMLALLALASPVFAQGGGAPSGVGNNFWAWVAAAFPMAIASGLCGLAQARVRFWQDPPSRD